VSWRDEHLSKQQEQYLLVTIHFIKLLSLCLLQYIQPVQANNNHSYQIKTLSQNNMTLKIPNNDKNDQSTRSIVHLSRRGRPLVNPQSPEQRKKVMVIIDEVLNLIQDEDVGVGKTKQ
jgi:hypothetical protein